MTRDAAAPPDADLTRAVLEGAIGALPSLFRVPSCAILLPSSERNALRAVARRELSEPQALALIELLAQREIAALLADGRPFLPHTAEGISPGLRDQLRADGWPDLIAVPLPGTGRPVGVLVLVPEGDGRWAPPRVDAALKTGAWLATSLRAAVRAGEGERRRRQAATLLERLPLARPGMSPEEALAAVVAGAGAALGVTQSLGVLFRPEAFAEYGPPGSTTIGMPAEPAKHPMWALLRSGGAWRYDDAETSPADRAATARLLNGRHPRAVLAAPVSRDGDLAGFLLLVQSDRRRRFTEEEGQFVHAALLELAATLGGGPEPAHPAPSLSLTATGDATAEALASAASIDAVVVTLSNATGGAEGLLDGLAIAAWDPTVRRWTAVAVRLGERALPAETFEPAASGDDLLSEAVRGGAILRGPASRALPRAWRAAIRPGIGRAARGVAAPVQLADGRVWVVTAIARDEAAAVQVAPSLTSLAPLVALALARLELVERAALRERRLQAVNDLLAITSTAGGLSAASGEVATVIRRELPGIDLVVVWLLNAAGDTLNQVLTSSDLFPNDVIARPSIPIGSDSGPTRVLRSGSSAVWRRGEADLPQLMQSFMDRVGAATLAIVPMRTARGVSGVISLSSLRPRDYSAEEMAFLEALAGKLGGQLDALQLRESAEAEHHRLRSLVDTLPEGLLLVDRDEAVRMFSPATERILGVPLTGRTIDQIYAGMRLARSDGREVTGADLPLRRALQGVGTNATEMLLVRPDDSETLLLESCRPVRDADGTVTGAVCVLQDLSALQDLSTLKSDFINTVSHELRTPITTIRGGALTLLKRRQFLDEQTQNDLLSDIAEEAERLHLLVSDLLSLTRSRSGMNVTPEPVLVTRLVDRVITQLGGRVGGHDLRVSIPPGLPPADADPELTEQILRNLLENAVKFSPRGGAVEVAATQQDGELIVSVLDRGSGVPAEDLDRVFEPFYRPDETKRSGAQGAGLGLAVCRRLVEMQGGRIWAEAREGGGAAFRFTLPVASGEE